MSVTLVGRETGALGQWRPMNAELLLSAVAKVRRPIVFAVKAFDPTKHPRGYKGLFIETPDKKSAGDAEVGDVIATQSGKVFRVESHGVKGIKVSSVDQDTGEVLEKGTVVANGIEVAVVQGGTGPGTKHSIRDVPPGTYVQHAVSGNRFKVTKHGKWTTVYPVNDQGDVSGKHTVLPPQTQVVVTTKTTSGQVTAQTVTSKKAPAKNANQALTEAFLATFPGADDLTDPNKEKLFREALDNRVNIEQLSEVQVWAESMGVDINQPAPPGKDYKTMLGYRLASAYVASKKGPPPPPEVLPDKLPNPPRPYAEGVGKDTQLVIEEVITSYDFRSYTSYNKKYHTEYRLKRTGSDPTSAGEVIGQYPGIGAARKAARQISGSHEAILEVRAVDGHAEPKIGDVVLVGDRELVTVDRVEPHTNWQGRVIGSNIFDASGNRHALKTKNEPDWLIVRDFKALQQHMSDKGYPVYSGKPALREQYQSISDYAPMWRELMEELNAQNARDPKVLRAARPNLFVPALLSDFDMQTLEGQDRHSALRVMKKLGYREVLPREKNLIKLIDARGRRVHIGVDKGIVTKVDRLQAQTRLTGGVGLEAFYDQLATVLNDGGDVRPLDPQNAVLAENRTSHARQVVFDMALGKQNEVELQFAKTGVKVKTDAEYRAEIEPDYPLADFRDKIERPSLVVPVVQKVMDDHWPQTPNKPEPHAGGSKITLKEDPAFPAFDEQYVAALIATGERNGVAAAAQQATGSQDQREGAAWLALSYGNHLQGNPYAFDPSPTQPMDQATKDYLVSVMDELGPRAVRQVDQRQEESDRRVRLLQDEAIKEETSTRRKAEGTVPFAPGGATSFELPLWDDIEFQDQDVWDAEKMAEDANLHHQVPMFFSGGLLADGVAYLTKRDSNDLEIHGRVGHLLDQVMVERLEAHGAIADTNRRHPTPHGSAANSTAPGQVLRVQDGPRKYIEYVPHGRVGQHGREQEAATGQRGQLRIVGYTAAEAVERLQDIGITHEMEQQVPYKSIMRSSRREGRVTPLHSGYVSGEAKLPKIPCAISHGASSQHLDKIVETGGLLSVGERFRLGLGIQQGSIPANDIRAGVDHSIFSSMTEQGSPYGDVNFVYKDSAYLRRDVLIMDRRAFGSGYNRYPAYRQYINARRREVGDPEGNIYDPVSPAARQKHIDMQVSAARGASNLNTSNQEWNVAHSMPLEDVSTIVCSDATWNRIFPKLQRLLAQGKLSEIPQHTTNIRTATLR